MQTTTDREAISDRSNPLGMRGIEFVEYATSRPQALGQALELMGFRPIARHRSREVLLYRQGDMNVIVNAHAASLPAAAERGDAPWLAALALRVRDAGEAQRRVIELGAWEVPVQVAPMELHIPAIHGVGASRIYFVDRYREFSIYDVDFIPIPGVERQPPALAGMHWFGIVQYIGFDRLDDWCAFYGELLGFQLLPEDRHFGVLPRGRVLQSPCGSFYLQLIEPDSLDTDGEERLQRAALGTSDVLAAVAALRERGVAFVEGAGVHSEQRGALTETWLGGLAFELVRHGTSGTPS
jgi:4-hydroxyphenylpyruvate dioxygenase